MLTTFALYLWCVTCNPQQGIIIHGIPSFGGSSMQWADLTCKHYGDALSGDWARRNMNAVSFDDPKGKQLEYRDRTRVKEFARKTVIIYRCIAESQA